MQAKNNWVVSLIKDPFRATISARKKGPCQECERKTTGNLPQLRTVFAQELVPGRMAPARSVSEKRLAYFPN